MANPRCAACALVRQYLLNLLDVFDNVGNALLGGDPNEKISPRAGRARRAGSKAAAVFCVCLSYLFTLGRRDHCQEALDKTTPPLGRQIWDWNTNRIERRPVPTVEVVETAE